MPATPTKLDIEVLKQFRLIFQSVRKHFQSIEAICGISGSQLWALASVVEKPGQRVTELAKAMAVHQSTASNLVESLVRSGLIQRSRSEADQRVVLLFATDAGKLLFEKAPAPLNGLLPDALEKLDQDVLLSLHHSLATLIVQMGKRVSTGAEETPLADMTQPIPPRT